MRSRINFWSIIGGAVLLCGFAGRQGSKFGTIRTGLQSYHYYQQG